MSHDGVLRVFGFLCRPCTEHEDDACVMTLKLLITSCRRYFEEVREIACPTPPPWCSVRLAFVFMGIQSILIFSNGRLDTFRGMKRIGSVIREANFYLEKR